MKVPILEAAKMLNVSTSSIRLWEEKGLIPKAERTLGGHRRYDLDELRHFLNQEQK